MTPFKPIFSLISMLILIGSAYLLWTWYQGEQVETADGLLVLRREPWRLWVGLPLLAWSFLGRSAVLLLFAKGGGERLRTEADDGITIKGLDGEDLNLKIYGPDTSPSVLLTHGWSLDQSVWQYAVRDLSQKYKVITWDLPGIGRSMAERVSLDQMAANLAVVLSHVQAPALLIGHSIGGMTIQTMIRNNPELQSQIAGIVLLNTTYVNPLRTMIFSRLFLALRWPLIEPLLWLQILLKPLAWLSSFQSYLSGWTHVTARLGFGPRVTRKQLDYTAWLMTKNSPSVLARGDLAMFRWEGVHAFSKFAIPTLIIGGRNDIVTLPDASERIANSIPGGRLNLVEEANHMGLLDCAKVYNEAIKRFADEVFELGGSYIEERLERQIPLPARFTNIRTSPLTDLMLPASAYVQAP